MIGYKKTPKSKQEWLTPPWLIEALGSFDLDPCAPVNRPWRTPQEAAEAALKYVLTLSIDGKE